MGRKYPKPSCDKGHRLRPKKDCPDWGMKPTMGSVSFQDCGCCRNYSNGVTIKATVLSNTKVLDYTRR